MKLEQNTKVSKGINSTAMKKTQNRSAYLHSAHIHKRKFNLYNCNTRKEYAFGFIKPTQHRTLPSTKAMLEVNI
jgi:hypothetical protein